LIRIISRKRLLMGWLIFNSSSPRFEIGVAWFSDISVSLFLL
jgi:hypothetical protein